MVNFGFVFHAIPTLKLKNAFSIGSVGVGILAMGRKSLLLFAVHLISHLLHCLLPGIHLISSYQIYGEHHGAIICSTVEDEDSYRLLDEFHMWFA